MGHFRLHRRSEAWPIDSTSPHQSKYMTCFTSISSPHIRRQKNTGKHIQGHPRSLCKVKRNMKWSQSCRHNAKDQVTHLNTRSTGRVIHLPMTHGCLMKTCIHPISLKNSTPREGRFKWLKGDENSCERSSTPSHVFPQ
jgi:hypothetical protein